MLRTFLTILGLLILYSETIADSWVKARQNEAAKLNLYWYTSVPFIGMEDDKLVGIEYDLMMEFRKYIADRYDIDLELNWIEAESFSNIMEVVQSSGLQNTLGVSAFSITPERKNVMNFTRSYLPDVTVLVSSKGTPIYETYTEVYEMLNTMTAITIKGTSYEKILLDLKSELDVDFPIKYIESDRNILVNIGKESDQFGFIDLPIYLMLIKNGGELTRQNFFTFKGTGYGFIMPKTSDWNIPLNEFLSDPASQPRIKEIISDHLGSELYDFIAQLEKEEQVGTSILVKEKELQLALIQNANLRLQQEKSFRQLLTVGIVISMMFIIIIGSLFYKNQKTTRVLQLQKSQIESQQKDIREKNEQLVSRNAQLLSLNEEKNNLTRILAHDLRSPLGQIIGLTDLLAKSKSQLNDEEKKIFTQIGESADRIDKMISKILNNEAMNGSPIPILEEEIDANKVLEDVKYRYQDKANAKKIALVLHKTSGESILKSDHLLLLQIMENLVSNAIKFSNQETRIDIGAKEMDGNIVFTIKDQGPGFTEEDKIMMFTRYQTLSAKPTGDESSTGLGLSIVKKYTKDLKGKIWLETEPGNGSTFFVQFPTLINQTLDEQPI